MCVFVLITHTLYFLQCWWEIWCHLSHQCASQLQWCLSILTTRYYKALFTFHYSSVLQYRKLWGVRNRLPWADCRLAWHHGTKWHIHGIWRAVFSAGRISIDLSHSSAGPWWTVTWLNHSMWEWTCLLPYSATPCLLHQASWTQLFWRYINQCVGELMSEKSVIFFNYVIANGWPLRVCKYIGFFRGPCFKTERGWSLYEVGFIRVSHHQ